MSPYGLARTQELAEQRKEYQKQWRTSNAEKLKAHNKTYFLRHKEERRGQLRDARRMLRQELFEIYGPKCSCCGETMEEFLTLEHLNGGGSQDRLRRGQLTVLREAIRMKDPTKFKITCFNCHMAAHHNGGICPHVRLSIARHSGSG